MNRNGAIIGLAALRLPVPLYLIIPHPALSALLHIAITILTALQMVVMALLARQQQIWRQR